MSLNPSPDRAPGQAPPADPSQQQQAPPPADPAQQQAPPPADPAQQQQTTPPKSKEVQVGELRRAKDAALRELELKKLAYAELEAKTAALEGRPVLPDPVLAKLKGLQDLADLPPEEGLNRALDAIPALRKANEDLVAKVTAYDIANSPLWEQRVTIPLTRAEEMIRTALAEPRIDATGKMVIKNQPFVDAALKALDGLSSVDVMTVKATLATLADQLGAPALDPSAVATIATTLADVQRIAADGQALRTNWAAERESFQAQQAAAAKAQHEARLAEITSNVDALAPTFVLDGLPPELVRAAADRGALAFKQALASSAAASIAGQRLPIGDALGVHTRAALFDEFLPLIKEALASQNAARLQQQADRASARTVVPPGKQEPAPPPAAVSFI